MSLNDNLVQALAILGPTASGKTALALSLAQACPIEIISIDSALVYKEMDIGTAKPTAEELSAVPHHLINIRNPDESYSAADFASSSRQLMREIRQRGAVPVFVGGTMMYYKALTQGLDDLPAADASIRKSLENRAALEGWPALHAELAQIDPPTAQRLAPNDTQRIQRALEVFLVTGQPLSSFFSEKKSDRSVAVLSLEPESRSDLHQRIEIRFAQMLLGGLVDEVEGLRKRWVLNSSMPSMRCVGYRQVWSMLEGEISMAQLKDQGVFATRQLAKRQLTWLRSMPERTVINPFSTGYAANALAQCQDICDRIKRTIQAEES
jgi:tRNA dimethylallyltransferase